MNIRKILAFILPRELYSFLKRNKVYLQYFYNLILARRPKIEYLKISNNYSEIKIIKKVFSSGYYDIHLPYSNKVCGGGVVKLYHDACNVILLKNCVQFSLSDVIKVNESEAIFYKIDRAQASKEIFQDKNLIRSQNDIVKFYYFPDNIINVRRGFSLIGVSSTHWAHFILEFLPKLIFSKKFIHSCDVVVVDKSSDQNIKDVIKLFVPEHVGILEIDSKSSVRFEELIFCSPVSYVCNHSHYISINDIIIPEKTVDVIVSAFRDIAKANNFNTGNLSFPNEGNKKIFIGYTGRRIPKGYSEIESLLHRNGYITIFPHLLSLSEKVAVFSTVEKVVGIGSSGFSNIFFAKNYVDVLALYNYDRSMGTMFSQLASKSANINYKVFSGKSDDRIDVNSGFDLPYEELVNYMKINNFL